MELNTSEHLTDLSKLIAARVLPRLKTQRQNNSPADQADELVLNIPPDWRRLAAGLAAGVLRVSFGSGGEGALLAVKLLMQIMLEDPDKLRRMMDAQTRALAQEARDAAQAASPEQRAPILAQYQIKALDHSDPWQSFSGALAIGILAAAIVKGSDEAMTLMDDVLDRPNTEETSPPPSTPAPIFADLPSGATLIESGDGTYQLYMSKDRIGKVKDIAPHTPLLIDRIEGNWVAVGLIEDGQLTLSGWTSIDILPDAGVASKEKAALSDAPLRSIQAPKSPL